MQGFYRINHEAKNENAGLGLGLAIAKLIMQHLGGYLTIESQLNVGTCVVLTLAE